MAAWLVDWLVGWLVGLLEGPERLELYVDLDYDEVRLRNFIEPPLKPDIIFQWQDKIKTDEE